MVFRVGAYFCAAAKHAISVANSEDTPLTNVPYQPPQIAKANGIEICYDIFGSADAEPLVLIMGLSAQMVLWDDEFCQLLAGRGFRVIRFDNRDIGQSTRMSGGKRITATEFLKLRFLGILPSATYTMRDMANDTTGLMDALGIRSAHIVGLSMGGAIAQEIAIHSPERMRSLTSIMSTTGNPRLPQPKREAMALLTSSPPTSKDEYIETFARNWRILRAGSFPLDEARDRDRAERCYARGLNPDGVARQFRAILASGNRSKALAGVKVPSLVIHGTVDPLVRPEAGVETARSIPGAKLLMIEGMGHATPIPMWPQIIGAIADHAHAATAKAA